MMAGRRSHNTRTIKALAGVRGQGMFDDRGNDRLATAPRVAQMGRPALAPVCPRSVSLAGDDQTCAIPELARRGDQVSQRWKREVA